METEISRFGQTAEALNDIDAALDDLYRVLQNKKNNLTLLQETARRSVARIDLLIGRLNAMQEENGTGNNHD